MLSRTTSSLLTLLSRNLGTDDGCNVTCKTLLARTNYFLLCHYPVRDCLTLFTSTAELNSKKRIKIAGAPNRELLTFKGFVEMLAVYFIFVFRSMPDFSLDLCSNMYVPQVCPSLCPSNDWLHRRPFFSTKTGDCIQWDHSNSVKNSYSLSAFLFSCP